NVCCGHRVLAQFVGADPNEFLALARDHLALPAPADVERHQQMEIVVSVTGESERRQAGFVDRYADFLMQLPDQRLLRPLTTLDLATGKFPQAGQRLAF